VDNNIENLRQNFLNNVELKTNIRKCVLQKTWC